MSAAPHEEAHGADAHAAEAHAAETPSAEAHAAETPSAPDRLDSGPGSADGRPVADADVRTDTCSRAAHAGGTTLLIIAKEPVPGRVKTRLTPPYTPAEAALLAEASLADTLHAALAMPARRRVLVLDGHPGPWLPPGFEVVGQCDGGLDERLAAAFAACRGATLLIGMDTPQVTPALLAPALTPGSRHDCDAWFGPAADGGFWALGLAEPDPELLRGVPMSTATTGAAQRRRLTDAGLRVRDLPILRDVDTAEDAVRVAADAPGGRFARTLARLSSRTTAR